MSARLIGDLVEWRRTPAGRELSPAEFIVLFAIADRVLDESTGLMRTFKGDDCELHDRISQIVGMNKRNLRDVFVRLARRGLEVRVVMGKDKNGDPVYASKGHPMQFRFPELPSIIWGPRVVDGCG